MLSTVTSRRGVEYQTEDNCAERRRKTKDCSCSASEGQKTERNDKMAAGGESELDVIRVTWGQLTQLVEILSAQSSDRDRGRNGGKVREGTTGGVGVRDWNGRDGGGTGRDEVGVAKGVERRSW